MSRRKKGVSKSQQGMIVLLVTVLLAIAGVFYSLTGINPGGIFEVTDTPRVVATVTPFRSGDNSWWEVYFTDPVNIKDPNNYANSVAGRLVEHINAARVSIYIAAFEFDQTPIAEALIAAHNRGVDVRWVTDNQHGLDADENPGRGQFARLRQAGIEVRGDTRTALMHNKFLVFDGRTVWTGSTNLTKNGFFVQDNNAIVIHSPEVAAVFTREFDEMWNGQFGPRSPSQMTDQFVVVNGTPIQVIFTPEDSALEQVIIPLVGQATSSIRFLAFSFTDYPLAKTMIDRAAAGVSVAGVMDKTQSGGQGSELGTLFCAKIAVRQDGNPQFMHSKVIIVDGRYVVTGSLNYSTSAEKSNDENVLIIDNPEIARLYLQNFEQVWYQASDPDPTKVTCQ